MLTIFAMLLAAASPACDRAGAEAALKDAAAALQRKDDAAAKKIIAPVAACPVDSGATYIAHVMAAELASREAAWAEVRRYLVDLPPHSETTFGARAQFLLMRADQGLGDAAAFASDRAMTLVANDARLVAAGKKLETFRVAAAEVAAYRATFDQGGFHRVLEFIATPDDKSAYPVTIMLTDDQSAASMMKLFTKDKPGAGGGDHAWFVDLYYCGGHSSLAPVGAPNGPEPDYAAVKARVVETLGGANAFASKPPDRAACPGLNWIAPGFGLRK